MVINISLALIYRLLAIVWANELAIETDRLIDCLKTSIAGSVEIVWISQ